MDSPTADAYNTTQSTVRCTFRWNFTNSSVRLTGEFHTPSDVAEISRLLLPRSSDETMFWAEAVRFELTELLHSPVFKTGALNHSATLPKKLIATKTSTTPTAPAADRQSIFWCRQQESNPRPIAYKAIALPTELYRHNKSWYFPLRLTLSSSQGFRRFINLVRMVGLEPTCFAARPPQDRVYTSFTTSAK